MTVVVIIEAVVIAVLGLLVCGLLRSHAEVLRTLRELEGGARPAPASPATTGLVAGRAAADVMGTTLDDEVVKIGVAGARHNTLLAFLSSGCFTCGEFWDTFKRSRPRVPGDARLVIVTKDPAEESLSRLRELAPRQHPLVMSSAAWTDYNVPVAPFFVYVDGPTGQVRGDGVAKDWDQVVALWSTVVDGGGPARRANDGPARQARVDRELLEAGIRPGDPSLRPDGEGR